MTETLTLEKNSKITITISLLIGLISALIYGAIIFSRLSYRIDSLEKQVTENTKNTEKNLEYNHKIEVELASIKASLLRIEEELKK